MIAILFVGIRRIRCFAIMKALSIVAPGGSRIASGEKTLEVRRWAPNLDKDEDLLIVENDIFLRNDGEEDHEGRVVAIVRIGVVRPFVPADIRAACASSFEEGWRAWELEHVRPLQASSKVIASRGIYELNMPNDASFRKGT